MVMCPSPCRPHRAQRSASISSPTPSLMHAPADPCMLEANFDASAATTTPVPRRSSTPTPTRSLSYPYSPAVFISTQNAPARAPSTRHHICVPLPCRDTLLIYTLRPAQLFASPNPSSRPSSPIQPPASIHGQHTPAPAPLDASSRPTLYAPLGTVSWVLHPVCERLRITVISAISPAPLTPHSAYCLRQRAARPSLCMTPRAFTAIALVKDNVDASPV